MGQILVRDVPDEVIERLKARAKQHGLSLNAEVRATLERAAARPAREEIRERLAALRAESGRQQTDSMELLREDRNR